MTNPKKPARAPTASEREKLVAEADKLEDERILEERAKARKAQRAAAKQRVADVARQAKAQRHGRADFPELRKGTVWVVATASLLYKGMARQAPEAFPMSEDDVEKYKKRGVIKSFDPDKD